jgi:hypothetical protein
MVFSDLHHQDAMVYRRDIKALAIHRWSDLDAIMDISVVVSPRVDRGSTVAGYRKR